MSESQPHSGSRWEPAPPHERATDLLDPPPARTGRANRRRRRALTVAAATGLLLLGGAGGYAIGHATAGTGAATVRQHGGGPGGFRGTPGGDTGGTAGTDGTGTGPST